MSGLVFIQPGSDINSRIQEITGNLHKNYLNKPDSLPALAEIVRRNQHWQIRQSAALELKKAAARYWSAIPDASPVKEELKQKLLDLLLSEQEGKVRQTLSRAIEPIAKVEVPAGKWPFLMSFIQQQVGSDGKGREIGLLLLLNLVETIPDSFTSNLQHVFELFAAGIRDPSNIDVQIISCKGIGAVACLLQKDQKALIDGVKSIIPEMVAVLQKVLRLEDRIDTAVQLIEVFDSLMMSDLPIVNQHAVALIQMFVEIARNTEISEDVRIMSLNFLMWAIVYKKQRILKEKIVEPIIQAILPIGLEPFEDEEDQESPPKMAFDLLNSMALNLPANVIFQPVMRIAAEYMKSNSSNYRLAGMMSMAVSLLKGFLD